MKHTAILRKLTAAVLSCALCCTGMTVPASSADEAEEFDAENGNGYFDDGPNPFPFNDSYTEDDYGDESYA